MKNSEKFLQYLKAEDFEIEKYYKLLMYKPLSKFVVVSKAERFLVLLDDLVKNKFLEFCDQNNISLKKFVDSSSSKNLKNGDVSWGKVGIGSFLTFLVAPQILLVAGAGLLTHLADKKLVSKDKLVSFAKNRISSTINNYHDFLIKVEADQISKIKSIEEFAKHRNIKHLCHFTRLENLESILKHGILSREVLVTNGIPHFINDERRNDNNRKAICLSVSRFNEHYLRSKKREFNGSFVYIYIKINLLFDTKAKVYFYKTNAANKSIKPGIGLDGFKDMFADKVEYMANDEKRVFNRHKNKRQAFETTDDQAEILFEGRVPVEYIDRIEIYNNDLQKINYSLNTNDERVKII